MKIMYPLISQNDYTELRYSLRSVEKYLKPDEVIIVGETVPNWINNVTQIGLSDIQGRKQLSVRRKVLAALEYTDEILYMNDDIYFLKSVDVPYYHDGELKSMAESGAKNLDKQLKEMNKPTKSFNIHYPLPIKKDFKEIIENFTDDCLIRSAYCNYLEIEGVQMRDCKIIKPMKTDQIKEFISGLPFFSTGVYSLQSCLPALEQLFPYPSIYEI